MGCRALQQLKRLRTRHVRRLQLSLRNVLGIQTKFSRNISKLARRYVVFQRRQLFQEFLAAFEALFRPGEYTRLYFSNKFVQGPVDILGEVRIALNKTRKEFFKKSEEVMGYKDLAVAVWTRPNTYGGY